ncbi:MAG TPA: hypothetical protein VFY29_13240 [Terriglobia bacterium]|nr:hypothetical protein [Terriglobia bacterium]
MFPYGAIVLGAIVLGAIVYWPTRRHHSRMTGSTGGFVMQPRQKLLGMVIVGAIVLLGGWSYARHDHHKLTLGIPAAVGQGDGGTLVIDTESTTRGRFSISFDDDRRVEEFWIPAIEGEHTWTINIPKKAGGYIEFNAEKPEVGDKLSWKITLNGKTVVDQTETLDQPLAPGHTFLLRSAYNDYSAIAARK